MRELKFMFRHHSPRFLNHQRRPRLLSAGFHWFFYGLIFGGVLVFIIIKVNQSSVPVQMIISTPEPEQIAQPEEYLWSESGNLGLLEPKNNVLAKSPLPIKGIAKAEKDEVHLRLKAKSQDKKWQWKEEVVAEAVAAVQSRQPGFHGPFETSLEFTTTAKEGTLEVFGLSAKDGMEIDKVIIPVRFK